MANEVTPPFGRVYRQNFMWDRNILPGNCEKGQLTDIGHKQQEVLGAVMRDYYVTKRQFLNESLSANDLFIRFDLDSRTQQSAMALIDGLYPPQAGTQSSEIIDTYCMDSEYEDLSPRNPQLCPCVEVIEAKSEVSAAYLEHDALVTKPLNHKLEEIMGVPVDNDDVCDCALATYCHGFPLPANLTDELVNEVFEDTNWRHEYKLTYPNASYAGRYTSGFLLSEIYDRMLNSENGVVQPRFLLYSAHDSTLRVMLSMFGVFDHKWPAYASYLVFELFSDLSSKQDYVRMVYNGQELRVPACQKDGDDCSFASFAAVVDTLTLHDDIEQECLHCGDL
eukprot:TRINITY_DN5115_c0_g3_i2.p1 TRINITY_DN5115_c0_g3~~TRINITY_DN5115_c0_g3_i2.p1  ORF type:complete len:336 (-),score=72.81 TRINITY_DN5115_c0_g3_i2:29-1036(-)